jgi:hypothetical protein
MFKQEAKLDLQTHLFLADTISPIIHKWVKYKTEKYSHKTGLMILTIVEKAIERKFNKSEELVIVITKARKCKKRIRNEIFLKILSKLDDDFLRLGNEVVEEYGFLYFSY